MSARLKRRLQTSWGVLTRRFGSGLADSRRLVVEKTAWPRGARSPVMLSVDDLTNAWHSREGQAVHRWGEDWGGLLDGPDSALRFLDERLLKPFPEARVTFFTVAGPISAYTHHQPFTHSAPLDATAESRRFFRSLAEDPRFELAYHGLDHGTAGERTEDFVQEWRGFPSAEVAIERTRRGLEIFSRATGQVPRGGKYGGWDYNSYAEEALERCGFVWWCRDWMPRDINDRISEGYYEPQFFGANLMVALPTTLHGRFWDRRQVNALLARRQIIAIEEHIAPVRPDDRIQTPNVVDDIDDLRRLYRYLRGKSVWHATGSEIADYVISRERTTLYDVTRDGFSVRQDGQLQHHSLTLRIDASLICDRHRPHIDLSLPDGSELQPTAFHYDEKEYRHLVSIPVMDGRYRVRPRTRLVP